MKKFIKELAALLEKHDCTIKFVDDGGEGVVEFSLHTSHILTFKCTILESRIDVSILKIYRSDFADYSPFWSEIIDLFKKYDTEFSAYIDDEKTKFEFEKYDTEEGTETTLVIESDYIDNEILTRLN